MSLCLLSGGYEEEFSVWLYNYNVIVDVRLEL